MKKDTKKLVGGGLALALLAALLWPKKAKAATAVTPPVTPPANPPVTPPANPGTPPAIQPQPPSNQIPNPGAPAGQPTSEPPTVTTQPVAPALSALVALWEYQGGKWVEIADVKLGVSDLFDQWGGLSLPAVYGALPQYQTNPSSSTPPRYQYFRVFTSDGTKWTQIPFAGLTKNY